MQRRIALYINLDMVGSANPAKSFSDFAGQRLANDAIRADLAGFGIVAAVADPPVGPIEAIDQTGLDWVTAHAKNDGDRWGRSLGRNSRDIAADPNEHDHPAAH
jgi:hypothetical protein